MADKILDLSYWQGKISVENFKKVKATGVVGVILRTSYTSQSKFILNRDSVFENNILNATKAGLKVGAYHYSQAISISEAQKEANYMLKVLKDYKTHISLPVFFDWEWGGRLSASKGSKLGKTKCTKICNAFCEIIKDAGYKTGVYASLCVFNGYLNPSSIDDKYLIWVAQYNSSCSYTRKKYMWQYTSSGKVNGLSGRIDMNYLYGDSGKAPISLPSQNGDVEVDGIWGSDTTRKLQKMLGTEQDGIVSSQPKKYKKYLAACSTSSWEFVSVSKGSDMIRALQKFLGLKQTGKMNQTTIKALQRKIGASDDGYFGSKSVRALQSYLNHNDK